MKLQELKLLHHDLGFHLCYVHHIAYEIFKLKHSRLQYEIQNRNTFQVPKVVGTQVFPQILVGQILCLFVLQEEEILKACNKSIVGIHKEQHLYSQQFHFQHFEQRVLCHCLHQKEYLKCHLYCFEEHHPYQIRIIQKKQNCPLQMQLDAPESLKNRQ